MESDKWIVCVEPSQVTMVDLQNGAQVTKRPIQAEAAIMNPTQNILALRSGTTLQIFNLDAKAKVKSHAMPEPLVFWFLSSRLSWQIFWSPTYHCHRSEQAFYLLLTVLLPEPTLPS